MHYRCSIGGPNTFPHSPMNRARSSIPCFSYHPSLKSPCAPSLSLPIPRSLRQAAAVAQAGGSFWLRARMNTEQFHGKSLEPSALAIVQYDNDSAGHHNGHSGHPMLKQLPVSKIWPIMHDKVGESRKKVNAGGGCFSGAVALAPWLLRAGLLTPPCMHEGPVGGGVKSSLPPPSRCTSCRFGEDVWLNNKRLLRVAV